MLQHWKTLSSPMILALAMAAFSLLSMLPAGALAGQEGILVTVDITPALRAQTTPEQTVFIYAKAAYGPRAPLAAVKTRVGDLPFTVKLDDSKALTPAFKLSMFREVRVTAHVSQSGQAIRRTGDFEGESSVITLGPDARPVELTIEHAVQ